MKSGSVLSTYKTWTLDTWFIPFTLLLTQPPHKDKQIFLLSSKRNYLFYCCYNTLNGITRDLMLILLKYLGIYKKKQKHLNLTTSTILVS